MWSKIVYHERVYDSSCVCDNLALFDAKLGQLSVIKITKFTSGASINIEGYMWRGVSYNPGNREFYIHMMLLKHHIYQRIHHSKYITVVSRCKNEIDLINCDYADQ